MVRTAVRRAARAERAERVEEALDAMELLDVADRLAGTYSGGMVRRLEVAQALVNRPSLLVLDEPTVGLDPIARDGVWTHVQNMQAQFGMTVLLTTHYMEEADALCDRVALMHHGMLRAVGTPTEFEVDRCRRPPRSKTCSGTTPHQTSPNQREESSDFREIRSSRKVASRAG